ncbi:MAG: hypothetical protein JO197_06550 [Acidobacteria bacterium]|nr:hypothetical protein [Acidobacteriota bacterium]MBV9477514.1 hypothetical protein [Acidobacteriota bacterium]
MQLAAVRAIKAHLRTLAPQTVDLASELFRAIPFPSVSIGIAYGQAPGDFKLAVRYRDPEWNALSAERVLHWLTRSADTVGIPLSAADIDAQHTGPVHAIALADSAGGGDGNPLHIGSSVSHFQTRAGTLGFFARSVDDHTKGFVSANHVIAMLDDAAPNDPIVHPGGSETNPTVGRFHHCVHLRVNGERFVDAAFATLATEHFDPSSLPGGKHLKPTLAQLGPQPLAVAKFADGTGETHGHVVSFDFDTFRVLSYGPHLNRVPFENQLEVESTVAAKRFSEPGDSGSLVYDDNQQAVGLLFAHSLQGGAFNHGFSYVNPISRVLSDLRVEPL